MQFLRFLIHRHASALNKNYASDESVLKFDLNYIIFPEKETPFIRLAFSDTN